MSFIWELIPTRSPETDKSLERDWYMYRAMVPGGWFIKVENDPAFFYPDPDHVWDGSAPQETPIEFSALSISRDRG